MSSDPENTDIWSVDARTGGRVERVGSVTTAQELRAVVRAAASTGPQLQAAGLAGRARFLRTAADRLEEDAEEIVALADRETALGESRLRAEMARTTFQLRFMAEVAEDGAWLDATIDHADPAAAPAPRPDVRRSQVPLGPVAVFAASNFPLAFSVAGGDTASALAAGCPVIVKAHPGHPATSQRCLVALREAATRSGLSAHVVGMVHGLAAGLELVRDPLVRAVGFTGSTVGGRALFDAAAARADPIPFFGELGSVNPLVVTPIAALERAGAIGAGLAASFTLGGGQFCTKPGLVLVPAGADGDRLRAALAASVAPLPAPVMLTSGIRQAFVAGLEARMALPGVSVVARGVGDDAASPRVMFTKAMDIIDEERLALLLEEDFGPVVIVVEYADEAELTAVLSLVPGSLTGTVHSGSNEHGPDSMAHRVAVVLAARSGRVVWNGYPTGVAVTWAMHHGGPYPSSTSTATSVGAAAIRRWTRTVCWQDAPAASLPAELQEDNPLGVPRRINGKLVVSD
ncbi:aldehyde dehydrogenase family protein [Catenulispora rubra]|uniref:aldehyde dehydrogenase family protein n=1 Tax=Catenulispora rubra TaxID=280293 RepID=UPI002B27A5CB|nr:aldehyde dehydrogenase family protein [Catenulispora rubra]